MFLDLIKNMHWIWHPSWLTWLSKNKPSECRDKQNQLTDSESGHPISSACWERCSDPTGVTSNVCGKRKNNGSIREIISLDELFLTINRSWEHVLKAQVLQKHHNVNNTHTQTIGQSHYRRLEWNPSTSLTY